MILPAKLRLFFVLSFCLVSGFKSQNIHIKYKELRSTIATANEDLYVSANQSLSVKDSLVDFAKMNGGSIGVKTRVLPYKNYYVRDLKQKTDSLANFIFNDEAAGRMYLVSDVVKIPKWTILKDKKKKILGYECLQAKTKFRGREYTAYYTPEIPISAGPFKFFGLPGMILEIGEDNASSNLWKAVEIDKKPGHLNEKMFADSSIPRIQMKEWVRLKDEELNKWRGKLSADMPANIKVEKSAGKRFSTEKTFEWEE